MKPFCALSALSMLFLQGVAFAADAGQPPSSPSIKLQRDDRQGQLRILVEGKEVIAYQYGHDVDIPHYYPVRSPSGKLLTVQYPDKEPHHRSIWFADSLQLDGRQKVSFYNAWTSRIDPKNPQSPFRNRIRHVKFLAENATESQAVVKAQLRWEADLGKTPMLDEVRELRIVPLGRGEYFLDMTFEVKAAYGDVTFLGNWIHYAWPYVRMHPQFSVRQRGGTITNSEGGINQKGTNNQVAHWVDYSNRVDGMAEGLAVLCGPEHESPHRWLTRDYGTFGPRRVDAQSGTHFTLKKDETLKQHVAILIHSGDVNTGRVKERYQQFIEGKL